MAKGYMLFVLCPLSFSLDCTHLAAPELDAVLVLGPVVVLLEILAEAAHVHVVDMTVEVAAAVLARDDRFLGRIHTTNRRAVTLVARAIARANALNPRNAFRMFAIAWSRDDTRGRSRRRKESLEL